MTMDNILITGGAGFSGSRLAPALLATHSSSKIWVIDNLHPQVHGEAAAPPKFSGNVQFIFGDVADAAVLGAAVRRARPEVIYHLAAETGTGQSYDEPVRYCAVNVIGTANLIEAIRGVNEVRRVVLATSRAVYGEGGYRDANGREFVGTPRRAKAMREGDFSVPLPSDACLPAKAMPTHAGLAPAPASIYASTKLMQEYLLTQAGQAARWRATLLRFQNVYGPGQSLRNPYTGVLSIFARQLLAGNDLVIYEDGRIARDFVYVDDAVEALVCAGSRDVPHGSIFDIGSGRAVTILEAARLLMKSLGRREDAYRITGD